MRILKALYYVIGMIICPTLLFNGLTYLLLENKSDFGKYWSGLDPIALTWFEFACGIWMLISVSINLPKATHHART